MQPYAERKTINLEFYIHRKHLLVMKVHASNEQLEF